MPDSNIPAASLVPPGKLAAQGPFFQCPDWAAMPAKGVRFDVVGLDDRAVEKLELDDSPYYLFGRMEEVVDYVVYHPSVSRVHCVIVHHKNGSIFLVDLASEKNGNFVNGCRVEAGPSGLVKLNSGDIVCLGQNPLKYILRIPGAEAADAAPPPAPADPVTDIENIKLRLEQQKMILERNKELKKKEEYLKEQEALKIERLKKMHPEMNFEVPKESPPAEESKRESSEEAPATKRPRRQFTE
eukprot:NODE_5304_length_959_cov_107.899522_g5089_i0.p1 GENE.NODE_5304_length_959_cov_107.899522_g5089_i0~~NODE_5304_length_959_cov_107.899522_g5089_i0.p1  ORF type:complete len:242 (-),score=43.81 NODE_5304_length_959_cov_107.899522_g5089_i0:107-832(-)